MQTILGYVMAFVLLVLTCSIYLALALVYLIFWFVSVLANLISSK